MNTNLDKERNLAAELNETNPTPTQPETLDELCPWCAEPPDVHDKNNLGLRYLGRPTKGCIGRDLGFIIDTDWDTRAEKGQTNAIRD